MEVPNKFARKNIVSLIQIFIEHKFFSRFIISLILVNAILLGLETSPVLMHNYKTVFETLDTLILCLFSLEIFLRLIVYKSKFFRDPWSLFDFIVISVAFIPSNNVFSVLRIIRVLRILRLISIFPRLRIVVEGLISAIPGISAIGAILVIVTYVFAVMATKLYGTSYPEWFGSLQASCFSLFQIMTLEGWPDIVRTVMKTHSYSWIFFITFILIATYSTLNLFIAVIVDGMQKQHSKEDKK